MNKDNQNSDLNNSNTNMDNVSIIISKFIEAFPLGDATVNLSSKMRLNAHTEDTLISIYVPNNSPIEYVKCKVIEYMCCYCYDNPKFRGSIEANRSKFDYMLNGINTFLGTDFDRTEIKMIDIICGGGFDPEATGRFILSGFSKNWLYTKFQKLISYRNY